MKKLLAQLDNWLEHRTGYKDFVHDALFERVPGGARWRYVWGSTLVFAFVVQSITGFFLWMAYSPNAQGAWESVYYVQHEMQGGWLLRGVHHFMAQAMVVLLAVHLMQVVIDGAYKAPREINFWIGLILMQVVLGLSLTGYLLPWDQKGYWATKVATNIMGITPVVGPQLQRLVVGGPDYGHHTLTRFFAIHAGLLPALLIGLLVLHIYVFRRHGLTAYKPDSARDTTFWPDQVLRDAVACLAVLAVVLFLVFLPAMQGQPIGADLGAPADPTDNYSAARPEWYFLFLFQLLKYFEGENEVYGSHVIPAIVMFLIVLMPFVGKWKLGHRFNVGFLCCIVLGIATFTGLAINEDNNNPSYLAAKKDADKAARRVLKLIETQGIGYRGARDRVRNDPLLQGPKVFAKRCASCHRYDGHDGTERPFMELVDRQEMEAKPTAADLGNFGSREWIRSVLTDYKNHFAAFRNATPTEDVNLAEELLENGQMAEWSQDNQQQLAKQTNQESLAALVEFVFAQGQREDLPKPNAKRVAKGRQIFERGTLADGELTVACTDCHVMRPIGENKLLGEPGLAPNLTGYGGATHLKSFISDPGSDEHYGFSTNGMPVFKETLSEKDLDLLVRWIVGDY